MTRWSAITRTPPPLLRARLRLAPQQARKTTSTGSYTTSGDATLGSPLSAEAKGEGFEPSVARATPLPTIGVLCGIEGVALYPFGRHPREAVGGLP